MESGCTMAIMHTKPYAAMARTAWGTAALTLALACGSHHAWAQQTPLALKVGKIQTVTKGTINNGVIVIQHGKIIALGPANEVTIPAGADVVDAQDEWAMPGQIDLHAHVGNDSGLHDYVHTLNPEFRVWDYIDPDDPLVRDDIASGVTTILTIPGSGGNHSGFGVLWKLGGAPREDLYLRKLGTMKVAQAYNPERQAGDLGLSRMGMWWMLREMFSRAKAYENTKMRDTSAGIPAANSLAAIGNGRTAVQGLLPARDITMENLSAVLEKKTPVLVHTAGARDVMGTMRMFHDEMDVRVIISHGEFGGFRAAEEAAKRNIPVNVGPRLYDFSYQTYDRKFYSIAQKYLDAGVQTLSLNTDCPVIPAEDLFLQGTISVRMGMDEDLALRAVTYNPAVSIGVAERVGSLEVGKDADIVLKHGSLFDVRNPIEKVYINGQLVYVHGQKRRGVGAGPFQQHAAVTDEDGEEEAARVESGVVRRGFLVTAESEGEQKSENENETGKGEQQ
jgi:imidazolonepropionase-like amidohydrolase